MIIDECSGAAWRMVRGDSLLVLRDLEAESVDAVITDPPYSSGGAFRGDRSETSPAYYEIAARRLRNCEAGRPRRQNDAAPLGPLFAGATP